MPVNIKDKRKYTDQQLILAIHEVRFLGFSIKCAARRNNVPKTTLMVRLRGGKSRREGHEASQRISVAEEKLIVSWYVLQDAFGLAPTMRQITGLVTKFLVDLGDDRPLSQGWMGHFIERHGPIKQIEAKNRAKNGLTIITPEASQMFYQIINNPTLVKSRPETASEANQAIIVPFR
ncbi:hypothetical protein FVEN_g8846 [Fusarium venenatum]|uniref:HTH CENPB-type domain-containing protein n=1 Tax=Fusarium venenatum TaxID=56646 RepID=A0A2L2T6S8_9HYPO|nr:uncharacterized protein FVRRES_02100 [Fusarium venenatum]KAG8353267.1 hypothetical protein FVEN_g8846 [Fusarium venenatum]CEI65588.1 unnamed protein product [Fusarium venenatum]